MYARKSISFHNNLELNILIYCINTHLRNVPQSIEQLIN